jgi:cytoskeletal protein RodZ
MSSKEVGQNLRQAREKRGLDIAEVAKATKIRSHYLLALEEGDFGALSSPAQVRGFLRTYADFLELDTQSLFELIKPPKPESADVPLAESLNEPEDAETQSRSAFTAIGFELKKRRESLQLTYEEIESSTRLPAHYLDRLENGDFDKFPSPSQARGMLGSYAQYLGLDSENLLGQYADAVQQRFLARQAAKPAKPKREPTKLVFRMPEWLAPLLSRDIVFGAVAGLFLLIFVVWSIGRIAAVAAGETPQPTAPPIIGLLLPSQGAAISATGASTGESVNLLGQETPTPGLLGEATIQAGAFGNIAVRLIATQRTWMRVSVDGRVEFEGRTVPGNSYSFTAANQISLVTGNGSALRAFLNEQDLGILGFFGQIVEVVFSAQGASTPTLSPTPTINPDILTATAESALTPSATPTATATPSPEATVDSSGGVP